MPRKEGRHFSILLSGMHTRVCLSVCVYKDPSCQRNEFLSSFHPGRCHSVAACFSWCCAQVMGLRSLIIPTSIKPSENGSYGKMQMFLCTYSCLTHSKRHTSPFNSGDDAFMSIQKHEHWWKWAQSRLLGLLYKNASTTTEVSSVLLSLTTAWTFPPYMQVH